MWILEIIIPLIALVWVIRQIKRNKTAKAQEAQKPPITEKKEEQFTSYTDKVFSPHKLSEKLLNEIEFEDLRLMPEPENKYDPNSIAVYYGEKQLGYLFKGELRDAVLDAIAAGKRYTAEVCEILIEYDNEKERYAYEYDFDDYDCKLFSIRVKIF